MKPTVTHHFNIYRTGASVEFISYMAWKRKTNIQQRGCCRVWYMCCKLHNAWAAASYTMLGLLQVTQSIWVAASVGIRVVGNVKYVDIKPKTQWSWCFYPSISNPNRTSTCIKVKTNSNPIEEHLANLKSSKTVEARGSFIIRCCLCSEGWLHCSSFVVRKSCELASSTKS